MKQLGIAMHNYATVSGVFPDGLGGRLKYSLFVRLLPQLDLAPLYNMFNFNDFAFPSLENTTCVYVNISILNCPSDPVRDVATTNYAGCLGDNLAAFNANGVFVASPIGLQSITDGSSSTAAMSEFLVGRRDREERLRAIYLPKDFPTGPAMNLVDFSARCRALDRMAANPGTLKGMVWSWGVREQTLYDHTLPCNQPSCNNNIGSREVAGATTATSLHPGGVNCLFADGHVQFARDGVDPVVWRALGTRAGGELISSSAY